MFWAEKFDYNISVGLRSWIGISCLAALTVILIISGFRHSLTAALFILDLFIIKILVKSQISFIGFELGTLTTLLTGNWFGAVIGALVGAGIIIFRGISAGLFGPFIIWKIPGFAILGALSGLISGSFYLKAMALAIGMRAIFLGFTYKLMKSRVPDTILYASTSLVFTGFGMQKLLEIGLI